MYGLKCDIPYEEVKADAYSFLEEMESKTGNQDNHFTEEDIEDALKAYKENYMTFPRKDIEIITGISIPPNKRNYRKQEVHLMGARAIQEINDKVNQTDWRKGNGRKSKKNEVIDYLRFNPRATKYRCIKETGLDKKTVYKYWEEAQQIIEKENPLRKELTLEELKQLIIKQNHGFKSQQQHEEFCSQILEAEDNKKIKEICLKYDFVPNFKIS